MVEPAGTPASIAVHDLRQPVPTPPDGIVSRTIHADGDVRVVLFSFAAGQQLSDHTAAVPVLLEIVDGEATIGVGAQTIEGQPGTWLHLPAQTPHSVTAHTPLTLLLVLITPPTGRRSDHEATT
jgi:quercetin dioxygenase-like cupin family protein